MEDPHSWIMARKGIREAERSHSLLWKQPMYYGCTPVEHSDRGALQALEASRMRCACPLRTDMRLYASG